MNKETTNHSFETFNPNLTTQSKPQSEFVYVSTSIPSAIVMISTQYQELSDKQKLELLTKLQEWIDNKQTEMEIKDMKPDEKAKDLFVKNIELVPDYIKRIDAKHIAKQCALIAVDEMISVLADLNGIYNITPAFTYWQEVKQ
jgi:hypothetical protein